MRMPDGKACREDRTGMIPGGLFLHEWHDSIRLDMLDKQFRQLYNWKQLE
ncbi:hypothetical protein [Brevibacillus porteri]|nr:hypothetical protein [Brevibacillus porteri]MED2892869.1 hypothetical protein [Brevibacillus porteri]